MNDQEFTKAFVAAFEESWAKEFSQHPACRWEIVESRMEEFKKLTKEAFNKGALVAMKLTKLGIK